MIARMGEIGIRVIFQNSMYEFGGKYYLQQDEGPTGNRVTMAASPLVMEDWTEEFKKILERSKVKIYDLMIYVDDGRPCLELMRQGTRYDRDLRQFIWRQEWETEDIRENIEDDKRMARILREAMNDISTNWRFTTESPSEFENRRLPTLDTELWVKDNQIHHSFYEKPTRTPLLIMENSGMAEHQKISILSNDLIRRLSNKQCG